MDSDLYKFQQQNFLNIITYYNKTKEKAENYYSYMQKYKEHTSDYLTQIKKLFNCFSPSLYNKKCDENINEGNKIIIDDKQKINEEEDDDEYIGKSIFDLDLNENKLDIAYIRRYSTPICKISSNKQNIDLDLSPIYKVTNIIFQLFKNQINGLKLLLKDIDSSMETFKNLIEKTKAEVNKLKLDYLDIKQDFFKNIVNYEKINNELLNSYSNIENTIIQICIIKNNEEALMNNKNNKNRTQATDLESLMNSSIIDVKKKEINFMKMDSNKKRYCTHFKEKSKECLEKVKNNTILIIKNLKINIEKFLSYYSNCYNLNNNDISQKIKFVQEINNELVYEDIIKQNLKEINDDVISRTYEKYKPKFYNIKILTNKNLANEIYQKLIKIGYNFLNSQYELSQNEEYYIMKKMNNFTLVNKDNYDFDKASKKLSIFYWFEAMFNFKNEQNNNESQEREKISDEKLFKYIEDDKDCRIYFLVILGNKRADAILNLPKDLFDTITKIFKLISDKILSENDIDSAKYLIILSQTFYIKENEEKIYITNRIKNHPLYQKEEFWNEYIQTEISEAFKKKDLNDKNIGKKYDEDDLAKRNNELVFAQLITMSECMSNFDLGKEKIVNIIKPMFDTYKINEENRSVILSYLNNK